MKLIKTDARPDLQALITDLYASGEPEPVFLEHKGKRVAVIVPADEYQALKRIEDALLDKLDVEQSEEILKDPKWVGWESLQKQLKS